MSCVSSEHDDHLLKPGDGVDHFEIVQYLGQGGTGEVYLAIDTTLDRKVALKLVHPIALGDARTVERFLAEAKITARFSHPNIVTIFSVGQHQGRPYLAFEYIEGETLRQRIMANGYSGLPWDELVRLGLAMAEALVEAHRNEVLHRDLKPENVLLSSDGRMRVVDFGLAKTLGALDEDTAPAGSPTYGKPGFDSILAGTPIYMAPEQWLSMPSTGAADIWSLGIVLHECLTGRPPFVASSIHDLRTAICTEKPSLVLEDVKGVESQPAKLVALILRCLDKLPGGRPTAQDVATELRILASYDASPDPADIENEPEVDVFSKPQPSRMLWRKVLIGGLIALAAVLIAVVIAVANNRDEPRTQPRMTDGFARKETDVVTVTLGGIPEGATVTLDSRPVVGPVLRLKRSPDLHELRVEMKGYRPWHRVLSLSQNRELVVDLIMERETPPQFPTAPDKHHVKSPRSKRPSSDATTASPGQVLPAEPSFETQFHP